MKDRVPQHPGRIKLIPVEGQPGIYDMERADGATETGTPLNKSTFLQDDTAEALGLTSADPTVNDAFLAARKLARNRGSWIQRVLFKI